MNLQIKYDAIKTAGNDTDLFNALRAFSSTYEALASLNKFPMKPAKARAAASANNLAGNPGTFAEGLQAVMTAIRLYEATGHFAPKVEDAIAAQKQYVAANAGINAMRAQSVTHQLQQAIHGLFGGPITEIDIKCDPTIGKDRSFNAKGEFMYSLTMGERLVQEINARPHAVVLNELSVWLKAASVDTTSGKPVLNSDKAMGVMPNWLTRLASSLTVSPSTSAPKTKAPKQPRAPKNATTAAPAGNQTGTTMPRNAPGGVQSFYRSGTKFAMVFQKLYDSFMANGQRTVTLDITSVFTGISAGDPRRMLGCIKVDGVKNGKWDMDIRKREVVFTFIK